MRLSLLRVRSSARTLALASMVFPALMVDCLAQTPLPTSVCSDALIPTVEQNSRDARRIYSYVSLYAAEEYDRLKSMSAESRGAEASYKVFSAEYNESKTREEFKDKTSKRIKEEKVFSDDKEATSYFRTGLEDGQLKHWSDCVTKTTDAGALLLSTRNERDDGFTLVVTWVEPRGAPAESLIELQVVNGKLLVGSSRRTSSRFKLTSSGGRTFAVFRERSSKGVSILANTPGFSDDVLSNAPRKQRQTKVVRLCAEKEPCTGHSAVLACLPSRDRASEYAGIPPGTWILAPASPGYGPNADVPVTSAIRYGKWSNPQCGLEGEGWHLRVGSCGTGQGEKWQRCDTVKVEFPSASKK